MVAAVVVGAEDLPPPHAGDEAPLQATPVGDERTKRATRELNQNAEGGPGVPGPPVRD